MWFGTVLALKAVFKGLSSLNKDKDYCNDCLLSVRDLKAKDAGLLEGVRHFFVMTKNM